MKKKVIFILFILVLTFAVSPKANAQCSMCTINAEQGVKNGNTQTAGLNTGVLYLLSIPYLMAVIVGVIWYKKYRKKNIHLNMKREPFNLN
ncbi:hypothetical protein G7074_06495 [Pedobacter sp. HDW13]|uniref:hypothetical protein n=1 Tax=unclassified Pedobacter TaxID=2628915 RepID=UPI000F5B7313|nr:MULTISPECIES: hypothetical protein [unclassified Pedobacter]QIL38962.1 hypothetical protein G7074_06495 [Pedobacter sp. HDW13]RQO72600.1 hypothetical protein DBR40_14935 [Pedobacter sp. KBW01]